MNPSAGAKYVPDPGLLRARRILRSEQSTHPTPAGLMRQVVGGPATLEATLDALQWRKELQPTADPEVVRRGPWKFVREVEEQRIALAEEIVRRVDPGPFEDPVYLALLAYQAASVEMASGRQPTAGDERWSRVLLGTIHLTKVDSFAKVFQRSGYTVVGIHSGLVEFIYQAAKVVVAAGHPFPPGDGLSALRTTLTRDAIEAELERNPEPVERLYRTLEAYFYKGHPRAFSDEHVEAEHEPALTHLVGMTERFVVAHEYGHKVALTMRRPVAAAGNPRWAQEYAADQFAMLSTVLSGHTLDRFSPEASLAGGAFALACLVVLEQGYTIVREGRVRVNKGSSSHPPPRDRAARIMDGFYRGFHVAYAPGFRDYDLAPLPGGGEQNAVDEATQRHIRDGTFAFAKGLFVVWERVRPMLLLDYGRRRPVHKLWATATS